MTKNNDNDAVTELMKRAREKRLFTKLEARHRLVTLANERTAPLTKEEEELVRLKCEYLPQWAAFARGSAVGKGLPGESGMVDYMRPTASWELERVEEPDPWVCNVLDAAIEEISPQIPLARAALSVRYLNAKGPAVYRSGRLTHLSQDEVEDLCDAAEMLLVPVVKRRNLPL